MGAGFNVTDVMLVGLIIEEITEEVENVPLGDQRSTSMEHRVSQPESSNVSSKNHSTVNNGNLKSSMESLHSLKNDPEAMRYFSVYVNDVKHILF